jgi:hypothetical protein
MRLGRRYVLGMCVSFLMLAYAFALAEGVPERADESTTAHDYRPLSPDGQDVAGPHGNLDAAARRFAILKGADPQRQRVTLLVEGEAEPKEWSLRPGAEVWCSGWWGRLDQFAAGDRVWVWFEMDPCKQPVGVALLADELSQQDLYGPVEIKAIDAPGADNGTLTLESSIGSKTTERVVKLAGVQVYRGDTLSPRDGLSVGEEFFVQTTGEEARLILDASAMKQRRAAQQAVLRQRWADEGLPGTLVFLHADRGDVEVMLDHESLAWGRSLVPGDRVALRASNDTAAVVRQLAPWRERTQVLLGIEGTVAMAPAVGERVLLRIAAPPAEVDDDLPAGPQFECTRHQRAEWLVSAVYCPCQMHDVCAGHFYTLAACDSGDKSPCGMAVRIRKDVAQWIDQGRTDREILEELRKQHGANVLRPHMQP